MTIKQAVILAGGLGKRLRPITDKLPKPLVDVCGQPFLFHILEQLKRNDLKEILILAGYKSNLIVESIKNFYDKDIKIKVMEQPTNFDTGARILNALPYLKNNFLLLYGDNYCGINVKKIIEKYDKQSKPLQLLAYEDLINFSKPNLDIDKDSNIFFYDTERKKENLKYVDVGYMCVNKEIFNNIIFSENLSFSKCILPNLIKLKKVSAYKTYNQYCSVGNMERLSHAREMLKKKKFIFLDRDGVLNVKPEKGDYLSNIKQINWKDGSLDALNILKKNGFQTIIVTNQAGIGRGIVSNEMVNKINNTMLEQAKIAGGSIDHIYVCPHHWEDKCFCRKPMPGLFLNAQKNLILDFSNIFFIGDQTTDMEVAEKLHIKYLNLAPNENLCEKINNIIKHYN